MSGFKSFLSRLIAAASVVSTLAVGGVQAQQLLQPPVISAVDKRGVNLSTGKFQLPDIDVGIGAEGSSLERITQSGSDNFSGIMNIRHVPVTNGAGPVLADVSLGGKIYHFTLGGGNSYGITITGSPYYGSHGAMLECTGTSSTWYKDGMCTVTTGEGVKAVYNCALTTGSLWGVLQTITKPDGEVISLDYYQIGNAIKSIKTVRSTVGWMLKYEVNGTYAITKVTGVNTAVSYCDPAATTCSGDPLRCAFCDQVHKWKRHNDR